LDKGYKFSRCFHPGSSTKLVTCATGLTVTILQVLQQMETTFWTQQSYSAGCVVVDWKTVDFSTYTAGGLDAGEADTNKIVMSFKPDALGTYVFTMQKCQNKFLFFYLNKEGKWTYKNNESYFWFTILTRCPLCHSKLIEVGYATDFLQKYKCKCGWGVEINKAKKIRRNENV